MQIGREQLRALPHNDGHGFPAAGIAVGIHPGRVYVIVLQKVFHQGYRLVGGGFAPIAELRRDNDHFLVILLGLKAEGFRLDIGGNPLEVQPFIAGERKEQGVRLAAVIALRDIHVIVNVAIRSAMEYVVHGKAAIGFCTGSDKLAFPKGRRILDPPLGHGSLPQTESMAQPLVGVELGGDALGFQSLQPPLHRPPACNAVTGSHAGVCGRVALCILAVSCVLHDNRAGAGQITAAERFRAITA